MSLTFIERHPDDAARVIEQYPDADKVALLSSMPVSSIALLLQSMTFADAGHTLTLLKFEQVIAVLGLMPANIAVACIRRTPAELREQLLSQIKTKPALKTAAQLLKFSPSAIGAIMDTEGLVLQRDMTVKQAIAFIRRHSDKLVDQMYVVDATNTLAGFVLARELILGAPDASIALLIQPCEYSLAAHGSLETAKASPGWRYTDNLPVIDNLNVLQGVLNRVTLEDKLTELDKRTGYKEQPRDIFLGLTETLVNTCSELLFPQKKI